MNEKQTKTTFFVLSIVTVILLLAVIASASPNSNMSGLYRVLGTPITWVQKGFSKVGSSIKEWTVYIRSYDKIQDEIDELRSENDRLSILESENERLEAENKELSDLLGVKGVSGGYTLLAANIIAYDVTDWFNTYTIDLGENDGIALYSPVITSAGLVGQVTEVGSGYSKITTIVDEENAIMCRVARTNRLIRVKGVSSENLTYELVADRLSGEDEIVEGDVLLTANSGDVYPEGLSVGTIKSVEKDAITGEITATVEPSVDLGTISKVYVMNKYEENN